MDESDSILLPILRDAGCVISDNVSSIAQFDSDLFYHCCALSLALIADTKLPSALPAGKAARFRLTSSLSSVMKDSGYSAQLGYEHFLYPSEIDMRKILRWIVDRLPKADDSDSQSQSAIINDNTNTANHSVRQALKDMIKGSVSASRSMVYRHVRTVPLAIPNKNAQTHYHSRTVAAQVSARASLAASLIQWNSLAVALANDRDVEFNTNSADDAAKRQQALRAAIDRAFQSDRRSRANATSRKALNEFSLVSSNGGIDARNGASVTSAFTRKIQFETDRSIVAQVVTSAGSLAQSDTKNDSASAGLSAEDNEERIRQNRETELAALTTALADRQQSLTTIESEIDAFSADIRASEQLLTTLNSEVSKLEEAYTIKKKTINLMKNAEDNEQQLTAQIEQSKAAILTLASEWEDQRQSLINKLRKIKSKFNERKEAAMRKAEQINKMRAEIKSTAESVRSKDATIEAAKTELTALGSGPTRASFIRRITDIIKNLDKQKAAIAAILEDLKQAQRDINAINEASGRSFALAEELLYRGAKTAGQSNGGVELRTYKSLLELRDLFVELVKQIESIGKMDAENRAHAALIEELEKRSASMNGERIQQDLIAIRKENKQLQEKLAAGKAGQE